MTHHIQNSSLPPDPEGMKLIDAAVSWHESVTAFQDITGTEATGMPWATCWRT